MALGVGLCNNGFMHHGNPALRSAQPPQGVGWGGVGVCPETELLAGTLVPGTCFSEGKQAQRQQVAGWRLPSKAVGVGLWTAVALGQLMHSPPPPPPVLHRWGDHFRCPVGTEVADQIHGLPKTLLLDGRWPPRVGSEAGRGGPGPWASWEGRRGACGDRGWPGCECEREEARWGLAPQTRPSFSRREKRVGGEAGGWCEMVPGREKWCH